MSTTDVLDDRYALGDPIGRGGACDVFVAHDQRLQRDVAVKVLRGEGIGDADRMATEVQLLASFNHPGLVQVYDAGAVDGQPYVVLELVHGQTLADRLRSGPLPAEEVVDLGLSVADALASVHDRGVVHRDITPANVLCGDDGRVRVADFGIARLVDGTRHTAASVALGTPAYMAPEQVRGVAATPTADVYALGLVLLEALTGRQAVEGNGTEVALARLVRAPDTTTDVPGGWRPLLQEMTALSPADRPSAIEVRRRLQRLATAPDEPTGAVPAGQDVPPSPFAPTAPIAAVPAEVPLADAGGTTVMPLPLAPPSAPPERRARLWWRLAAVLALVVAVAAGAANAASDGGGDPVAPTSTTSTTDPVILAPVVSAPTATTQPPPAGKGKEKPEEKPKEHPGPKG